MTSSPLKAPQARPDAEADRDERRRADAGLQRDAHGGRGQRDDRGDREVDLAGDDQQRHGEGDHRLLGEVEGRVREVPGDRGNRARRSVLTTKIATATATSSASQLLEDAP